MKTKPTLRNSLPFGAFYFLFFSGQCLIMSYMNVYLEQYLHFTGTQLGLFSSLSLLLSILTVPLVGAFGDRTGKHRRIAIVLLVLTAASAFALSLQHVFLLALFFGILLETFRSGIVPTCDAVTMNGVRTYGGDYGQYRSCGSIGWVICGTLVGLLLTKTTLDRVFFPMYVGLLLLTLGAVALFPPVDNVKKADTPDESKSGLLSSLKYLLSHPQYRFLMLVTLTGSALCDSLSPYNGNHLVFTLNAPVNIVSVNTVLQVIPEILYVMVFTRKILPKFGFKKIYAFSMATMVVRFAIYLFAPNFSVFVLGSLLHGTIVACGSAGNLAFMRAVVPDRYYGTAIAVMTSVIAIGRAFYGAVYGFLYESFGSRSIYVFVLSVTVLMTVTELCSHRMEVPVPGTESR